MSQDYLEGLLVPDFVPVDYTGVDGVTAKVIVDNDDNRTIEAQVKKVPNTLTFTTDTGTITFDGSAAKSINLTIYSKATNWLDGSGVNSVQQKCEVATWNFNNGKYTDIPIGTAITIGAAGENSASLGKARAEGKRAVAEGSQTIAIGSGAHAEGTNSVAKGGYSHAEGNGSVTTGMGAHAEGQGSIASGTASHAEGNNTTASANSSHAEGYHTTASGTYSHSEGEGTVASSYCSHAGGQNSTASGNTSFAQGKNVTSNHNYQTVFGVYNNNKSTTLFEIGNGTDSEHRSNAFEVYTNGSAKVGKALNNETDLTVATKGYVDAVDSTKSNATNITNSTGSNSLVVNNTATASGSHSIANGYNASATGYHAIALGDASVASRDYATAIGDHSTASGYRATSIGTYTVANKMYQFVIGRYNDNKSNTLFEIGNGTNENLSNAFEVYADGSAKVGLMGNDNLSITTKQYVDTTDNALAQRITNLEGRGRFLSTWNASTGKPGDLPSDIATNAYQYKTGDYYIVETAGNKNPSVPASNTIPAGTTLDNWTYFVTGTQVEINDTIYFTGSVWTVLHTPIGQVAWGTIIGTLSSQTDLQNALNGKSNATNLENGTGTNSLQQSLCSASGANSFAEGSGTTASKERAHAEGFRTKANGIDSHSEGNNTTASGFASHSEGYQTIASGDTSHAEGSGTKATSYRSHAEGYQSEATKDDSHAEGYSTKANGDGSHSEGSLTIANGLRAHAEGYSTKANGIDSHASGNNTVAGYFAQTVVGKYNNNKSNTLFEVGNGIDANNLSNAFEVYDDGTAKIGAMGNYSFSAATRSYVDKKCTSYVLNYSSDIAYLKQQLGYQYGVHVYRITPIYSPEHTYYLTDISQNIIDGEYDNVSIDNGLFNSDNDVINLTASDHYLIFGAKLGAGTSYYLCQNGNLQEEFGLHTGDLLIVENSDVQNRWMLSATVFKKFSKVNLTNYVDLSSAQTVSGVKTFSSGVKFGGNKNARIESYGSGLVLTNDDSGANFSNGSFDPRYDNVYSLGGASNYWKDAYLSGNLNLKASGNTREFKLDSSNDSFYLKVTQNNVTSNMITFYPNSTCYFWGSVKPMYNYSNTFDLGDSSNYWKDLYLSGSLKGNNNSSISVSDIENSTNKVTSISSSSTDTQYASAKCVWDNLQNVREVAEGKCKSWVLSYSKTAPTEETFQYAGYYDIEGNLLQTWADFVAYLSAKGILPTDCINNKFNSNNNYIDFSTENGGSYILCTYDNIDTGYNVVVRLVRNYDVSIDIKVGDIFYVMETNVADRWFDGRRFAYKLETSKVDLTNYVDLSSAQTITGTKTFNVKPIMYNGIQLGGSVYNYFEANNDAITLSANGGNFRPSTNTYTLGDTSHSWQGLYLNGATYYDNTTYTKIYADNRGLCLTANSGRICSLNTFCPGDDGTIDLGASNGYKWKDLYLSGGINGKAIPSYPANNGVLKYVGGELQWLNNGLTLTDNTITELKCEETLKQELSDNVTYTFQTPLSVTGTNLSIRPEYNLSLVTTAAITITLPSGTYELNTNDNSITLASNVLSLPISAKGFDINIATMPNGSKSILVFNYGV